MSFVRSKEGKSTKNNIRNENKRKFKDKSIDKRIRYYGHVLRMNEDRTRKKVLDMILKETRSRRPKSR
jgi:hypothetical protein